MSLLYISEYKGVRQAEGGLAQVGEEPSVDQTPLTFSTEAKSAEFGADTKMVRVTSDTDCHIVFGKSPTATTSNKKVIAGSVEYFGVVTGHKISAIDAV